jgi:hypothetical protein
MAGRDAAVTAATTANTDKFRFRFGRAITVMLPLVGRPDTRNYPVPARFASVYSTAL